MIPLSGRDARLEYGKVFTTTTSSSSRGPPSAGEDEILVGDYKIVGYGVAGASLS